MFLQKVGPWHKPPMIWPWHNCWEGVWRSPPLLPCPSQPAPPTPFEGLHLGSWPQERWENFPAIPSYPTDVLIDTCFLFHFYCHILYFTWAKLVKLLSPFLFAILYGDASFGRAGDDDDDQHNKTFLYLYLLTPHVWTAFIQPPRLLLFSLITNHNLGETCRFPLVN